MFAYTRESFLMQLWLLLEFVDVPIETIRRDLAIKCFGNTMQGCDQPLDEEMAAKMIEAARRCF